VHFFQIGPQSIAFFMFLMQGSQILNLLHKKTSQLTVLMIKILMKKPDQISFQSFTKPIFFIFATEMNQDYHCLTFD
jgi:hypothetical protein